MKVFEFLPDMDHYCPWTTDDGSLTTVRDLGSYGAPVAGSWQPLAGHIRQVPGNGIGDFPKWLDPVFSQAAREALADLLDPCGEWLPLETAGPTRYFVYNVTVILDCLDADRSRVRRFPSGIVMFATRLVFQTEKIVAPAFKTPDQASSYFFMTDEVVDRIDEHGLRGLAPRELWDGELGGRLLQWP